MNNTARRPGLNPPLIIGIVILVVVALMLCAAGYMFLNNQMQQQAQNQPTPSGPQPEFDVPTAREGYPEAVEVARAQDPGAQLTSAAGAWTPTIFRDNLDAGRTSWTYYFYLPGTNSMLWVTVVRGLVASVSNTETWDTPPALVDHQSWQVDSAQAITVGMEKCRDVLISYPDSTVEARLSLAASQRGILWYVTVTPASPEITPCRAVVDGTSGVAR